MKMRMNIRKRVLIIGNGYVGSLLYNKLDQSQYVNCREGEDHLIVNKLYNLPYFNIDEITNILNNKLLYYDYVINCVGYTGKPNVDACESDKDNTWYLNVIFPKILANCCVDKNIKLIHISSGCIFNGYDREFKESDIPNFGVGDIDSSWYSRTKHAGEIAISSLPNVSIFRIRMPITAEFDNSRNYLSKILKYPRQVNLINSRTNLYDFCQFVEYFIFQDIKYSLIGYNKNNIYHIVNPDPISPKQILELMYTYGLDINMPEFIELDELYKNTKCKRSNCILSNKITTFSTGFEMRSEIEALELMLSC